LFQQAFEKFRTKEPSGLGIRKVRTKAPPVLGLSKKTLKEPPGVIKEP